MALQGDDNALVHAEHYRYPWQVGMEYLGFEAEAIYRDSFDTLEFCSCRFYKAQTTTGESAVTFGPKPGKVLAKFGVVIDPPRDVDSKCLLRGICLGLRKQVEFIPPLAAVVERGLVLTEGSEAVFARRSHEYSMRFSSNTGLLVTPEILYMLDHVYGWSVTFQNLFEANLNSLQLGDSLNDILADLLMDKDISIPTLRCIFPV